MTSICNVNNKSNLNFQIDYYHIILQKLIKNILKNYNLIYFSLQVLKYSCARDTYPALFKIHKILLENSYFMLIFC